MEQVARIVELSLISQGSLVQEIRVELCINDGLPSMDFRGRWQAGARSNHLPLAGLCVQVSESPSFSE